MTERKFTIMLISHIPLTRAIDSPGASLETGVRAHCAEVLLALRAYSCLSFGWGVVGWPSLVLDVCPLFLVLC